MLCALYRYPPKSVNESRGGKFAAKRAWFSCGSELYGFAVPAMLNFCENAKL